MLGLLFGDAYREAGLQLAVLYWAQFFAYAGLIVHQVALARNHAHYIAYLTVWAAVLNIGLNIWAIPRYGAIGAAWTSLVSYGSIFLIGLFVPAVTDIFRRCFISAARPALASLLILGALHILAPTDGLAVAYFAVIAPVALLLTRSTSIGEVRSTFRSLAKRGGGPSPLETL